ncbi:extracellular solute-binding protein [Paeniglutamicibacter cryotolerans]|uniref:Putative spermidine/putrescine transport system substrate-binding protein n=1 Tax=Paeniglutamicibacter cryotolerans TaxID=670079 RepID=A0A839QHY2_9MICC|nr:extracellular solute-binding protein [Paeniglutamicibacter cryotolerans]MBB2995789.1 putative spermidine/putrescine transport system substrate-binding protein [Paeniglutamicibacter cryotolerans]
MKSRKFLPLAALAASATLILAGCSGASAPSSSGGIQVPDIAAASEVGESEGQVNIIAWAGFVEDGSTNPDADWVSKFEANTQCKVNRKVGATSDEMVQLMRGGEYDLVSASGDASLRLIAGGDVAPVNTELIPNFGNIVDGLKGQIYDTLNGKSYGVPIGRGANVLMYNTDQVKEAPTSWADTWAADSAYKGKVMAYDSPIFIADAAVYLMATQPDLGITNPYALDKDQLAAAVELLKTQNGIAGEYWNDALKAVSSISSGTAALGTGWQVVVNLAQADGGPVKSVLPKEGATGWSDTWMISSKSKNPNCAYKWMDYASSAEVNAKISQNFGMAPASKLACEGSKENEAHCDTFHATDEDYYKNVWMWTTPVEQCIDGRTDAVCTNYQEWTKAWTEVKG